MKLTGTIKKDARIIRQITVVKELENSSFRDLLEENLIALCKELDIQVPLWLKKNTAELGAYKRTFFTKDQFVEKVFFDVFELKWEQ